MNSTCELGDDAARALKPYPAHKDSGIEWLGQVPAHWKLRHLGRIGRLFKGGGGTKEDEREDGIPCVRYGDLYTHHRFFITASRACVAPELAATAYTPIAYADDRTGQHVQRGEQRGRAVALVVMGHRAVTARLHRQARLRTVQGLNLALLVHAQHDCLVRRVQVQPHDVRQFFDRPTKRFTFRCCLNVVTRCGCSPCASQIRWTVERLTPAALAIERQLQCVAPGGVSCSVECTMACTWCAVISGLRPRPVRTVPTEPSPSERNRARHFNTVCRLSRLN